MPLKRPEIINGEIYHIVIKAIEDLNLFRGEKDYWRMIHDLFEFNNENPTLWVYRQHFEKRSRSIRSRSIYGIHNGKTKQIREPIIEILAFCLMPNHVHLLVRQIKEGGIVKFMRKLGAGYAGYYNKKYKRQGHLFQGRYRIVHIKTDEQLKTVFVYVHTNPVAIIVPNWKEKGIGKSQKLDEVIDFLEHRYKWSSYPDYIGIKNFPSLTNREFLGRIMGDIETRREFVNGWLQFKKELADLNQIGIE